MNETLKLIGNAFSDADGLTDEQVTKVFDLLGLVRNSYVVVEWPESQLLMDEDWFEEEAILDVECKFGSAAYFVPINRLI